MSRFYPLTISEVKRETADAVSVQFAIPSEYESIFVFKQGQYVTLRVSFNNETIQRSYSICSSPFEKGFFRIGVKKVDGGKLSTYINQFFKTGLQVDVMEPNGKFFTELNSNASKQYYLFAGGSGITPMMSIIKAVLEKEPSSTLTLFYGNRNVESIIFYEELQQLQQKVGNKLLVVHTLEHIPTEGTFIKGIMNKETNLFLLKKHAPSTQANSEFFICGPEAMMNEAKAALQELNYPESQIHIEYFTAKSVSQQIAADAGTDDLPEIESGNSKVTIKYDGKTATFEMNIRQTVLEAALDAGHDPPYSCMVAACCTCRAKVLKGKVKMDDRESLTDAEINDGYVLTCQSHPKTAELELDYDI